MITIKLRQPVGLLVLCLIISISNALENDYKQQDVPSAPLPNNGAAVDEVVVESSLYIKPKPRPIMRRTRSIINPIYSIPLRVKREPQRRKAAQHNKLQPGDYSQSQAASNAAAQSHNQNQLGGFDSAAANAQAQAFQSSGGAGSFGASSAGTLTQSQSANKYGLQNSAAASHSQTFNLPNGQSVNFASTNSFANGPLGNNANSRGSAVSVNQG